MDMNAHDPILEMNFFWKQTLKDTCGRILALSGCNAEDIGCEFHQKNTYHYIVNHVLTIHHVQPLITIKETSVSHH